MRLTSLLRLAAVCCGVVVAVESRADIQAGLLAHEFSLTLESGERFEAVGPFWHSETKTEESSWAFSPLISRTENPGVEAVGYDFLYPLLGYNRYGTEYRFHIFHLINFNGGIDQEDEQTRRFNIFPLYFQQRSPVETNNYTAVVPFYGHLKNRLLRDEIHFVLFPIYSQTRKKDVITKNYVFPIFHTRKGDGLTGWQVWPLFGTEEKVVTTRTNVYDEVETVAGHKKGFTLWPIHLRAETGIGTSAYNKQWALLPFYNSQHSTNRDSVSYGWPLGVTITDDRAKQYREVGAPWPLVVFSRGEGKHVNRIWPFFSKGSNPTTRSDFYLWPIYKYNQTKLPNFERERTRILFFLYSDRQEHNLDTREKRRRRDFWPLYSHSRDFDGKERLQVLSILEPFFPYNDAVQKHYSPLWSLWRSENNPVTEASSKSVLWNLYRQDRTAETRKDSLLFGLFQYQSGPDGRRVRLFYLPSFGSKKTSTADREP